jgi:hypothetical protein
VLQSWSKILAHLTLTVWNLTPTSITSIATPPFPHSMLCVVFYTSKVLRNIDKGGRGCLDMKFCIKWASMYIVIRNEVKVMLFRLSAPRIFDQDCSRDIEIPLCLRATLETFVGGAVIYFWARRPHMGGFGCVLQSHLGRFFNIL